MEMSTLNRLKSMIPDLGEVKPVKVKGNAKMYTTKKPDGVKEYTLPNGEKTKNYKLYQSAIQQGLAPRRKRDALGKFTAPTFVSVAELKVREQAAAEKAAQAQQAENA